MEKLNLVSAVANLQKEMEFYRAEYRECREIIRQLSGQPLEGAHKYIHPFDVAKIFEEVRMKKSGTNLGIFEGPSESQTFLTIGGQRYKQSVNMPIANKKFYV